MNHPSFNFSSSHHPFEHPSYLPLYSVDAIAAEPIVVVAPHPDDETLGCGGAIACLQALGLSLWILVMSDGTQSHPNSRAYPAPKLKALRQTETCCAMNLLGVSTPQINFFELQDGALPMPGSAEFGSALECCCRYLSTKAPSLIFVPWRFDPHPDHRATWHLITTALKQCLLFPRIIEYPIWDWDTAQRQAHDEFAVTLWRLDISSTVQLKQRAIAAYRSQTTSLIEDDPEGFRLTPTMLANFTHPWELYIEEK